MNNIDRVAEAAVLKLISRIMATLGVPIAGFFAYQMYNQLQTIDSAQREQSITIKVIEQKLVSYDNGFRDLQSRTNRLEDRVFINPTSRRIDQ